MMKKRSVTGSRNRDQLDVEHVDRKYTWRKQNDTVSLIAEPAECRDYLNTVENFATPGKNNLLSDYIRSSWLTLKKTTFCLLSLSLIDFANHVSSRAVHVFLALSLWHVQPSYGTFLFVSGVYTRHIALELFAVGLGLRVGQKMM